MEIERVQESKYTYAVGPAMHHTHTQRETALDTMDQKHRVRHTIGLLLQQWHGRLNGFPRNGVTCDVSIHSLLIFFFFPVYCLHVMLALN